MDDILLVILYACLYYIIFKLGENYAYLKIARGLQFLQENSDKVKINAEGVEGVLEVEKLNGQYYAYLDDAFVGQCSSFDGMKDLIQKVIDKDPNRYSTLRIKMKE